jgi:2-polyprenyl-3-methyl-5-hydroxy-6-metoxy-1,4-benzoquinol methylase
MKLSRYQTENGIIVGNGYDKYESGNPIVKWILKSFRENLEELVSLAAPRTIHEVGCGEGYWTLYWLSQGMSAIGTDFSETVIGLARANATERGLPEESFNVRSLYDLDPGEDCADLIVCCEVLEHLEDPHRALKALQRVTTSHLILSVPREPLWCLMNLARLKYLKSLGNTPGHIQHWSQKGFVSLVSRYFEIVSVRSPPPFSMILCRPRR